MAETLDRRIKIDKQAVEIILELHVVFQDEAKVAAWLATKNLNFGNIQPLKLMQLGRGKKVLEFVREASHGLTIT